MDRGRQVIRQWKLLGLLEGARLGATVADLHGRLDEECHERTIRRDLESLVAVGFPLTLQNGRWRLLRQGEGAWSVPVQPSMVVALIVSEALLEGSPLAFPLRDLRGRVEAMLTPRARAWCEELRRRVAVNPPPMVRVRDEVEAAVDTAVRERRRLRVSYWSPTSGESERTLEPLLLWHALGGLYVVGWDDRSGEVRMFAMQRIRSVVLTDEVFEPDPSFDPTSHLRSAFGVMAGPAHRVVVEFAPAVAHLFEERAWHASQRVESAVGGWVRVSWSVAGLPEVARWLAGFGGDARVVAPEVLRADVRRIHKEGLSLSSDHAGR